MSMTVNEAVCIRCCYTYIRVCVCVCACACVRVSLCVLTWYNVIV